MQQSFGDVSQNINNPMILGQMQDCIDDCLNCHNVCMDVAMSSLGQGAKAEHLKTLMDCSEICLATAHSMMRNSGLHGYFCKACQAVCTHCADVCGTMGQQDCANACQACANSCQQMVKMAVL